MVVKANDVIPANTAFTFGTSGATWKPALGTGYNFMGAYSALVPYAAGDVVVHNLSHLYFAASALTAGQSTPGVTGSLWTPYSYYTSPPFTGTDGTTNGRTGMVPQPTTADVGKVLASDGTWANVGIYDWATSTAYKVRDYFNANNRLYKVLVAHTSSTISADLNAGRIVEVSSRDYTWVTSTTTMTTADGDSVIIVGPHTINLPPSPANGDSVRFATPGRLGDSRWRHGWLQAQLRLALVKLFPSGFDVAEFIYNATANNWCFFGWCPRWERPFSLSMRLVQSRLGIASS